MENGFIDYEGTMELLRSEDYDSYKKENGQRESVKRTTEAVLELEDFQNDLKRELGRSDIRLSEAVLVAIERARKFQRQKEDRDTVAVPDVQDGG